MTKRKPRAWADLSEVERTSLVFEIEQTFDGIGQALAGGFAEFVREAKRVTGFPFTVEVKITLVPVPGSTEQPIEVEVGLYDRMLKGVE